MINQQPLFPVNIFGGEFRRIRLSRACFVKQFVVGAFLGILFARDNLRMFLRCHGPAMLAPNLRPDPLG